MKSKRQKERQEIRFVPPDSLRMGPPQRETLSAEQTERVRKVYAAVGKYMPGPFEWFESGFLFDRDLEREMRFWEMVVAVHAEHMKRSPGDDPAEIYDRIVSLSLGQTDNSEKMNGLARLWTELTGTNCLRDFLPKVVRIPRFSACGE